ncbi:rifin [Plasmodium reichenowi]|uniref:Rifin n=1 Tax=Plasmodium reichenowi TaxID=5854 RepID=A0A060RMS5_PLARE|nr:rifin [Plasmodium reichenowi]
MKVHYINILLCALPLNILENNQWNHYMKPHTYTNRSLCECDLYMPNYDNDPQMKKVMQQFQDRTTQRFHEYEERMKTTRQKCKDQCDKEIQKIILKDKIDKELAEKFATLQTDIQSDAIPTCVCEKSLAHKMEKTCLRCGGILGGIAPSWGLVSGIGYELWTNYAATTLVKIAMDAGIAEGVKVGLAKITEIATKVLPSSVRILKLKVGDIITAGKLTEDVTLSGVLKAMNTFMSGKFDEGTYAGFSTWVDVVSKNTKLITTKYTAETEAVGIAFNKAQTGVLTKGACTTSSLTTAIIVSVVVIVVIVLVMVIIYLILRYRRKKQMKTKLQYIKLLKE